MRPNQFKIFIFGFLLILVMGSCSRGFNKLQRSEDPMVKYEAAVKYYEDKKYARAAILLEDILPILTGRPEGEKAQFIYAYSHFYQKLYIESAYYFNEFYNVYGRSPQAEEALFMHGYSLYLQSPNYNLDQTSTLEAVTALQNFINQHPQSEYREKATQILDELQFKLANKAFDNARLFYDVGRYKSALVVLETFADDFPDSQHNEEAAYLRIQAAYDLARNSLPSKQPERYREVVDVYLNFVDRYPDSRFLSDAEKLYISSQAEIEDLSPRSTANNNQ
jgi:outer membrane protein assembly factor BamD